MSLGLAVSADGARLATSRQDTARVWDVANKRQIVCVEHENAVVDVSFSPRGHQIVTASHDLTARVWDAQTGVELVRLTHNGAVVGAAFSPDGTCVVTAAHDKLARVWQLPGHLAT